MVGKKKKNQALHVIKQTSQRFCRVSDSDTREFSPTSKIENANGGELNHDYTVDQVSSSINELPHGGAFATFRKQNAKCPLNAPRGGSAGLELWSSILL